MGPFAGLDVPASRLLPLTVYCSPNQPNSIFLSQQTSRNSVFQPSFRPANRANIIKLIFLHHNGSSRRKKKRHTSMQVLEFLVFAFWKEGICCTVAKPLCDKASTHGVKFHESITTLMAAWNDHSRISEASVQSFCNKLTQNKQQGKLRSNLADQTHWIKQQGNLGEIHSRFHCHRCTHADTAFQMIFYLQHRH